MRYSLKLLVSLFLITSFISTGLLADNDPEKSGPYKYELTDEARNIIASQIEEIKRQLNDVLPEEKQSNTLKSVFPAFLDKYREYLKKYFTITGKLPDVIGPEAIGEIDAILKEENGFNTYTLKEEYDQLVRIVNYEIAPEVQVALERMQYTDEMNGKYQQNEKITKEELITKLNELIIKLEKYEKSLKNLQNILKVEMASFSKKVKIYVNHTDAEGKRLTPPDIKLPEYEKVKSIQDLVNNAGKMKEKFINLYIIDDIVRYSLTERDILVIDYGVEEVKNTKIMIQTFKKLAEENKLSRKHLKDADLIVQIVTEKGKHKYEGVGKAPALFDVRTTRALLGSGVHMLFAITLRDIFHGVTEGRFLSASQRAYYSKYNDLDWQQKMAFIFEKYGKGTTYAAFGTFIASSHAVSYAMSTSKLLNSLDAWVVRVMYGQRQAIAGSGVMKGMRLLRGVSTFALSMGVGAKLSEVVGTYMMLQGDMTSGNQKIQDAANDLFMTSNFSTEAWHELAQFIVSFGLAEMVFAGVERTVPKFYSTMKKLNKKRCSYSYEEIMREAELRRYEQYKKQSRYSKKHADDPSVNPNYRSSQGEPDEMLGKGYDKINEKYPNTPKAWYSRQKMWQYSKNYSIALMRTTSLFIAADFIDSFAVSKVLFPNSRERQEKKLEEKYMALMMEEINALTVELILTTPTDNELGYIYDKFDDLTFLQDIIPMLRDETDAVKTCLGLRDFETNEGAIQCLQTLYYTKSSKDPAFAQVVATYSKDADTKMDYLEDASSQIYAKEHVEAVRDQVTLMLEDIMPQLDSTPKMKEIMTVDNMTDMVLMSQDMNVTKTMMLESLKMVDVEKSKAYAKRLIVDLYFIPELYPLMSSVIEEGLNVKTVPMIEENNSFRMYSVSTTNAALYLNALVNLFLNLYPKMLNTHVFKTVTNDKGETIQVELLEMTVRAEILEAMAIGLYDKLLAFCSPAELEKANQTLDNLKRYMILCDSPECDTLFTSLVLMTMSEAYEKLGLRKKIDFKNMDQNGFYDENGLRQNIDFNGVDQNGNAQSDSNGTVVPVIEELPKP